MSHSHHFGNRRTHSEMRSSDSDTENGSALDYTDILGTGLPAGDTPAAPAASTPRAQDPAPSAGPARAHDKRARIDESVASPGTIVTRNPLRVAEAFIESHVESLHEGIASLLLARGKEYLLLAHRIHHKYLMAKRMEDSKDYVPVLARINFTLQWVKEAEELPEFTQLQADMSELVTNLHMDL